MTIDVQRNRIFYVIRAWGARATSWLIDYGMLWGETVEEHIWTDLAELIATPICGRPLQLVLIDSGFRPGKVDELPLNRIYDFCRFSAPRSSDQGKLDADARPYHQEHAGGDIEGYVWSSLAAALLRLL
jgi:hypothetical protein